MSTIMEEQLQSTGNPPADDMAANNPLTEEFEKIVLDALKEWNVPGVSIAIVDNDQIYLKVRAFSTLE